jgi:hypothetical protein
MRRQILAIAILSVTTSPAAFAKDLPLMGTQADESGNSATLEIVDQKNTIKVTCETFQIQAWTPSEDDKGDSTSLDCGGVSIDATRRCCGTMRTRNSNWKRRCCRSKR